MPKKRSSKVATRKKKKSWWSFFFVLAIATAIGLPIAYNMTNSSSRIASRGGGDDVREDNSGPRLKPDTISVSVITLSKKACSQGFEQADYTCTDGFQATFIPNRCMKARNLFSEVEKICKNRGKNGATPTPTTTVTSTPTEEPTVTP